MRRVRGLFASLFVIAFVMLGPTAGGAAPGGPPEAPGAAWDGPGAPSEAPPGKMIGGAPIPLPPTWFDPAETSGIITPFMVIYALHDSMLKPMPGNPTAPSVAESW